MNTESEVLSVLDDVLSLNGRAAQFNATTPLLRSLSELDSMAVVGIVTMLEERFDFIVDDDEIDGETFETVGTLVDFVSGKLG